MNPASFLTPVLHDTLQVSLPLFRTELALAATIVLVLLVRMLPVLRRLDSGIVALGGILFAAWFAWSDLRSLPGSPWLVGSAGPERVELFTGFLVFDPLTAFLRFLLTGFLLLFSVFTRITGIPDREDAAWSRSGLWSWSCRSNLLPRSEVTCTDETPLLFQNIRQFL